MSRIPNDWKAVRGDTYAIREELKELGARFDRGTSMWYVAPEKLRAAEEVVERHRIGRAATVKQPISETGPRGGTGAVNEKRYTAWTPAWTRDKSRKPVVHLAEIGSSDSLCGKSRTKWSRVLRFSRGLLCMNCFRGYRSRKAAGR